MTWTMTLSYTRKRKLVSIKVSFSDLHSCVLESRPFMKKTGKSYCSLSTITLDKSLKKLNAKMIDNKLAQLKQIVSV